MSRPRVLALGVLTLLSMGLLVGSAALFVSVFASLLQQPPARGEGPPPLFLAMLGLNVLFMALVCVLSVLYVVHAMRSPRVPPARRPLWLALLFLGGPIAMSVYWYLYLWREEEAVAASPR